MFASFNPVIDGNLKTVCNIGVGGTADYIIRIESINEFVRLYRECRSTGVRLTAVGRGSNLFFTDDRIEGVVAILNFTGLRKSGESRITAAAGTSLSGLVEFSFCNSLSGLELFSGIPGTVGGALYGNAGAYGSEIGSRLRRAEIVTREGEVITVDNDFFRFGYRDSVLKRNGAIVLEAELELARGDERTLRRKSGEIKSLRARKLPPEGVPTAGSYFKNICLATGERKAAAFYLEGAGSKGCSVGDAYVFEKHANIICNRGCCSAADILTLEQILTERVKDRFGLVLEREVIYID